MLRFYRWSLYGVLRARPVMAVALVAVLGATYYLYQRVPKGFIPDSDSDLRR